MASNHGQYCLPLTPISKAGWPLQRTVRWSVEQTAEPFCFSDVTVHLGRLGGRGPDRSHRPRHQFCGGTAGECRCPIKSSSGRPRVRNECDNCRLLTGHLIHDLPELNADDAHIIGNESGDFPSVVADESQ